LAVFGHLFFVKSYLSGFWNYLTVLPVNYHTLLIIVPLCDSYKPFNHKPFKAATNTKASTNPNFLVINPL
jgi:hypothetical protein